ncbi:MAG: DUF2304 domain-containing protein [Bacilli bacterium]|nr:DUF2304 domain-containing protein [Bacilli bacterium]
MQINLIITLIAVALFLIILTTYILKKGRISEKYALLWYGMTMMILLVALFPNLFVFISEKLGFKVMSNLIMGILIGVLILILMALTIMIAGQKKKTILLIQEISILKSEIRSMKENQ